MLHFWLCGLALIRNLRNASRFSLRFAVVFLVYEFMVNCGRLSPVQPTKLNEVVLVVSQAFVAGCAHVGRPRMIVSCVGNCRESSSREGGRGCMNDIVAAGRDDDYFLVFAGRKLDNALCYEL